MSIGESRDVRFVSLPIKMVRHGKCSDVPIAANGANEKPPRGGRSEIQSGDLIGAAMIFRNIQHATWFRLEPVLLC